MVVVVEVRETLPSAGPVEFRRKLRRRCIKCRRCDKRVRSERALEHSPVDKLCEQIDNELIARANTLMLSFDELTEYIFDIIRRGVCRRCESDGCSL